jgi:integrase
MQDRNRPCIQRKSEIVAEKTSRLPAVLTASRAEIPFGDFYKDRFLPMKTNWSEPHRVGFNYIMDRFILPRIGKLPICDIDKVMVQAVLNPLATRYSQSTLKHVRTKMVEVFEEAVEQEFITRNPATKTKIPAEARKPEQPILSELELIGIIDKLTDPRDLAIFMTGTFCALRTSEVFGLPWKNFHHESEIGQSYFIVDQIAYRGKRYQRTKNAASKSGVPIGEHTLTVLLQWQSECKDTSPDALMFPSTNRNGRGKVGDPMYPGVWLQKRLQPLCNLLGIPFKVNFRATRRTAASLVQAHGAALATASSFLRHASVNTTASIYSKPIPESVKIAVNDYEDRVYAARKKPMKLTRVK